MRDNISILIKRAKNYKTADNELIPNIAYYILEYGEALYLEDLDYLIIGTAEAFGDRNDAVDAVNATELKDGIIREVTINTETCYVGGKSVNELIKNHKYLQGVKDITLYGDSYYNADIDLNTDKNYLIANVKYAKGYTDKEIKVLRDNIGSQEIWNKTLKPGSETEYQSIVNETLTKYTTDINGKVTLTFEPIKISYDQIEDGTTYKRPLPATEKPSKVGGEAYVGKSIKYAREDHVHNLETTGNNGKPIYINSNGVPTQCNDTLTVNISGSASSCTGSSAKIVSTSGNDFKVAGVKAANGELYYNDSVTVNSNNVLMGAAWNDFAEFRRCDGEAGTVVCEVGDGTLEKSRELHQPGAAVISDTYGMIIGPQEEGYNAIAVAGRVLVKYYGDKFDYLPGMPVCAGPEGLIYPMTREEIKEFPESIVGYVSEIPTYDEWNNVKVNNRIWIKVR